MTEPLLQARALRHAYPGAIRALDGVDFDLGRGQLTALLGPNGSGKSSLLRALAGTLRVDQGTVLLEGTPLRSLPPRRRARRIAVVPQVLRSLPQIRVADFVAGGRYPYLRLLRGPGPEDRRIVERSLERADVADLGERLVSELSGGQRQRVLVARALAQEADLLLCDEPTSSLDPEHQIMVLRLLRALADLGHGVLLVSHDFHHAAAYADRVVLLREGRVAAEGTPREVFQPAALEPVYGSGLRYLELDGQPLVVPWDAVGGSTGPSSPAAPR